MKKEVLILGLFLMVLSPAMAMVLNIDKLSSDEVMIYNLNEPATFDLSITDLGASDNIMFYSYFGSGVFPKGTTLIGSGESKEVLLKIYPPKPTNIQGYYNFDYYIKSANSGEEIKQTVSVKIVDFQNVFEIGSGEFNPESSSVQVYVQNKVNFNFELLNAKLKSEFFSSEKEFSLAPYEKKILNVNLERDDFKKLMTGNYPLTAEITSKDKTANVEGVLKYNEKSLIKITENSQGFFINSKIIEKENIGNVVATSETVIKKNIISRLFTTFNQEPNSVVREGFTIYYTWGKNLSPGEKLNVVVRTNWLFPFIIILLLVSVVMVVKKYTQRGIVVKKHVMFVNAKGGEFALKVSIVAVAKNYVEKVNIIDRLPPLMKMHEKFGGEMPLRVDEKSRRIEWNLGRLEPGEKRVMSYIVYSSKIGVLGKFVLPSATAVYEMEGKLKESFSNRAFFVTDQFKKDVD
jgi:hypothetical protein